MNITFLLTICILVRIILIYLSFLSLQTKYIYLCFSFFYIILGIGSFYHFITNSRKQGAFNQTIWWHYLRPVHGIFFIISSYLIYRKSFYFVYVLIIDTLITLIGHIYFHYIK